MPKLFRPSRVPRLAIQILLLTFFAAIGAQAGSGSDLVNQRVKASLNSMVQDVHAAESPAEKRAVLDRFLTKAERGARLAQVLPILSDENQRALNVLQGIFEGYAAELHGVPGQGASQAGVANGELNAFASYMQQNLEQANNGIYLSTGAIIIVLLIILILL
jgi:hypothetical protein